VCLVEGDEEGVAVSRLQKRMPDSLSAALEMEKKKNERVCEER
jgi:hypothetical protein